MLVYLVFRSSVITLLVDCSKNTTVTEKQKIIKETIEMKRNKMSDKRKKTRNRKINKPYLRWNALFVLFAQIVKIVHIVSVLKMA